MKKIIFGIIILGLVVAVAGFWLWQRNSYSKSALKIEILGPNEVDIAQEVDYVVKYKNNGDIALEDPKLIFEFPEYTSASEGGGQRQEIEADKLGTIYPGEEKSFHFKGRLFGKEGDTRTAKVSLSYNPRNLTARYESTTTLTTLIKSVSLSFEFDLPTKIEAGKDFNFSINYFSSLDYPLPNLGVRVEYPADFEFLDSVPKSIDKNSWDLPVLNKTEGGRIDISGRLSSDVKDQKIFKATLGIWMGDNFVPLKETMKGVETAKPNLYIFQRINGNDQYVATPGEVLHYEIFFRNIGEDPFEDLFLVASFEGKGYDLNSVKTDLGQFNKSDKSIVWDWRDVPKLKFLGNGDEGKVEFWINAKADIQVSPNERNFVLKNNVLISRIKESFETKLNTKLAISQKGFYQDEAFGNTGPIPPKVGQPTTYTIFWQIRNYYNDVKNVKVKAVLPFNVNLTSQIFPETERSKFTFDSQSREIIWNASDGGGLGAGTGLVGVPLNISFQVVLVPSANQTGQTVPIISEAKITGEDQWTDQVIESSSPAINTSLLDDPYNSGGGIVQ